MSKKINLSIDKRYIPIIPNAEEELRTICENRAIRLYGEMPRRIREQLEWEINSLKTSEDMTLMLILGRVLQSGEIKPYMINARGDISASMVSYLLQITKANPLPPHYRCERGDYYNFDTQVFNASVGADLPTKLCPICGKKLIGDGFNLHKEFAFGVNGEENLSLELNVPQSKKHKIIKIIENMAEIKAVISIPEEWISEEMKKHYIGFENRKLIIPSYFELKDIYTLPQIYDESKLLNEVYPFYCLNFYRNNSLDLDKLTALSEISNEQPENIEFSAENILYLFSEVADNEDILEEKIRAIIPECNPLTVADCIKTEAVSYNHIWKDIGKRMVESGKVKLSVLPATREDVYEQLLKAGIDKALSFDITKTVYMGRGLSDIQQKLLLEHGLSKWFIDFCNNIKYLFPRAHIAERLIIGNRLEYYRYNHLKLWKKCYNE